MAFAVCGESKVTVQEIRELVAKELPFAAQFGLVCEEMGFGESIVRIPFNAVWTRPGDYVAGPVLLAAADAAMYFAIASQVGVVRMAVTQELKMNFLRPAKGGDIVAHAKLLKLGRRTAYGLVDLVVAHTPGKLVAQATTSYAMPFAEEERLASEKAEAS